MDYVDKWRNSDFVIQWMKFSLFWILHYKINPFLLNTEISIVASTFLPMWKQNYELYDLHSITILDPFGWVALYNPWLLYFIFFG